MHIKKVKLVGISDVSLITLAGKQESPTYTSDILTLSAVLRFTRYGGGGNNSQGFPP